MSKMLEETRQQPEALAKTLEESAAAVRELRRQLEANRPRLVILVARGTSDNAAQFGRYLIEITTHIPVSLAAPSVLTLYASPLDLRDVLVVGISQSGESTDTNAVLADARSRGAITLGITNEPDSTMAEIAEYTLLARRPAKRRAWRPPRPTPASFWRCTWWRTRWAARFRSMRCASCRSGWKTCWKSKSAWGKSPNVTCS